MRLLLDTHIFFWATLADPRLKAGSRELILTADEVYVSAASIWEIAIKARLGKLKGDPFLLARAITTSGFVELPITSQHAAQVAEMPNHHGDPFDRLLIAQALTEPLRLLTADRQLAEYSELVLLAE